MAQLSSRPYSNSLYKSNHVYNVPATTSTIKAMPAATSPTNANPATGSEAASSGAAAQPNPAATGRARLRSPAACEVWLAMTTEIHPTKTTCEGTRLRFSPARRNTILPCVRSSSTPRGLRHPEPALR